MSDDWYHTLLAEQVERLEWTHIPEFCVENSFEHDFVEDSSEAEKKDPSTTFLSKKFGKPENGNTIWNAKVGISPSST